MKATGRLSRIERAVGVARESKPPIVCGECAEWPVESLELFTGQAEPPERHCPACGRMARRAVMFIERPPEPLPIGPEPMPTPIQAKPATPAAIAPAPIFQPPADRPKPAPVPKPEPSLASPMAIAVQRDDS